MYGKILAFKLVFREVAKQANEFGSKFQMQKTKQGFTRAILL